MISIQQEKCGILSDHHCCDHPTKFPSGWKQNQVLQAERNTLVWTCTKGQLWTTSCSILVWKYLQNNIRLSKCFLIIIIRFLFYTTLKEFLVKAAIVQYVYEENYWSRYSKHLSNWDWDAKLYFLLLAVASSSVCRDVRTSIRTSVRPSQKNLGLQMGLQVHFYRTLLG